MHLLNAYCCHFYGSQARSFNDKNIKYIITAWNRAVRKIWNLPYDSHRILICALNNDSNVLDFIIEDFIIEDFIKCINTWPTVKIQSYPCS